jgi:elongation factor Ts
VPVTDIPADLVKRLRDETGAGMMDCKRALQETGGDFEAAKKLLRERGMAEAGKRAGRETTEGIVLARISEPYGTLVAVGCETEPVSKNEGFLAFANRLLETVEAQGPEAADSLEEERQELVGKIGENIAIRGTTRFETQRPDEVLTAYVHPPANKIGVLVRAKGPADVARLLAMHIAFAAPLYASRGEISEEDLATERAIFEKLPEVQARPEEHRERIVEGMLSKRFFGQTVLADQEWIHETGKTVEKALEEHRLEVLEYQRYALAG